MEEFKSPFKRKMIYIFAIDGEKHKGILKIGDTTIDTDDTIDKLFPNSSTLNKYAHNRIKSYTNTAGITYKLLHTELATKTIVNDDGREEVKAFRDKDVHKVLIASGIPRVKVDNTTAQEWFKVDLETAINAIDAVKKLKKSLTPDKIISDTTTIIFRPEQEAAIEKTVKQFKKGNKMLWNAKMRFGKTLCALEVVRKMKFKRTIIVTHRPVVNAGWYDDFKNIFIGDSEYIYGSKSTGQDIEDLELTCKNYVYFASVQDLRGSNSVGGKFEKNDIIFNTEWDFIVIDEAHEGTTTSLGENVLNKLIGKYENKQTKLLALSGTPFNIIKDYKEDELYTWDYIMEQSAKYNWDKIRCGDSNPYEELPKLNMYTYNLGSVLGHGEYSEIEDKAFNFKEFFRVWTGDKSIDFKDIPPNQEIGDFVHENDINSFLNLLSKSDENNNYPYSTDKYRELFKHSLWMIPGVKEARALSKLMRKHHIFKYFDIVNVAGDGDFEDKTGEALKKVKDAIKIASITGGYTITLSCGKLTTGVTVPEWTTVMMLSGSYSTSASNYLQTIFRVQSPGNIDGKMKENCYVFDFAPDRTLKMVADAVNLSTRAGRTDENNKKILGEFLNFCPIISIDGTKMEVYNTSKLLQQLKRAYAERAVKSGFDDNNIYNEIELSKLTEDDIEKFHNLRKIVGSSSAAINTKDININDTGLTNEEYEEKENLNNIPKKSRTEIDEERLRKLKEKADNRKKAISTLRAISIRMPLLIYGANINFEEDITADKLVDIVDDYSWKEFMPVGVTKKLFKTFMKYYDMDVFIAASRKIREIVKTADTLAPTQRIEKITDLFSTFKNPDKETVLTPWRVVNMHIIDCLGGYNFFDNKFEKVLDNPNYIYKGKTTDETLSNPNAKILEVNSKTGLYPLHVSYSIFRNKCNENLESMTIEEQNDIWEDTIKNNIFVVCKTPMAKAITQRTLLGYRLPKINAHCFDDLTNILKNKPANFVDKVTRGKCWNLKGCDNMKFDAIVGNPPYQEMDGGNGASASPIYNHFVEQSLKINTDYVSMIMPARWYAGGKGLDEFRKNIINNDNITMLVDYPNSRDIFPQVDIAGGICYFLWEKTKKGECEVINVIKGEKYTKLRKLNEYGIFIRDNRAIDILRKVNAEYTEKLDLRVSSRKPFGLPTNYKPKESGVPCWFIQKIGMKYANSKDVEDKFQYLDKWKLLAPKAPIAGQTDFSKPVGFYYEGNTIIAKPNECCTESYIILGAFNTEKEVLSYKSYIFTKIVRFLLLQAVVSQDVTKKNFCFIPDLKDYNIIYDDEILRKMWNITDDEWNYIDSRIHNYDSKK